MKRNQVIYSSDVITLFSVVVISSWSMIGISGGGVVTSGGSTNASLDF